MSVAECFGIVLRGYLCDYLIFLLLLHCKMDLYSCHTFNDSNANISLNLNTSNVTINTTLTPLNTEFETSFSYYTTQNAILPNSTSTIDITLHFQYELYDNNSMSISIDHMLLTKLTQIFKSLLHKTLINSQYANYEDILHLLLTSDINTNRTNRTNTNLYLKWVIFVLLEDEEIINILSEYMLSTLFIHDFNMNLDELNANITLIKTATLEIHYMDKISTTDMGILTTTNATEVHKDRYLLPQHLREFMLLYVILFCMISISLSCVGFWFCTMKLFGNNDEDKRTDIDKDNKPICNDLYLNASTHQWDEIDKNDAEYMMKAFDDDEALHQNWYKDSDDENSEIQMIQHVSIRQSESLTLTQRLNIHKAFDED